MAFSEDDCTGYRRDCTPRFSHRAGRAGLKRSVRWVLSGVAMRWSARSRHTVIALRQPATSWSVRAPRGRRGTITFGPWRAAEGDRRAQEPVRPP